VNQKHFALWNTLVTSTGLIGSCNYSIDRKYTNIKTEEKWSLFIYKFFGNNL